MNSSRFFFHVWLIFLLSTVLSCIVRWIEMVYFIQYVFCRVIRGMVMVLFIWMCEGLGRVLGEGTEWDLTFTRRPVGLLFSLTIYDSVRFQRINQDFSFSRFSLLSIGLAIQQVCFIHSDQGWRWLWLYSFGSEGLLVVGECRENRPKGTYPFQEGLHCDLIQCIRISTLSHFILDLISSSRGVYHFIVTVVQLKFCNGIDQTDRARVIRYEINHLFDVFCSSWSYDSSNLGKSHCIGCDSTLLQASPFHYKAFIFPFLSN